jgi:hypothetical protein
MAALRACSAISIVALLAACDIFGPGDCVSVGGYGLRVLVQDSVSSSPPPSGTQVIARDGAFADTARLGIPNPPGSAFYLVGERAGIYEVLVEAPGYRPWSRSHVEVERARRCQQIQTVTLLALIQR